MIVLRNLSSSCSRFRGYARSRRGACSGYRQSPGQVPRGGNRSNRSTPHNEFVAAAKVWLQQLADDNDFAVDYITNTDPINDAFLTK